ncbi:hypothetical protein CVH10_08795 [Halomonas sp. ND22Bw]|uniref:hypothetical protein n=1 Tax=Halomonas sp. ND22Bw TaxID=2054178 RepID=UPI000D0AF46D|nr:hypothetical protein CVH10_08795 [Halomonas sp. ND22Bw]
MRRNDLHPESLPRRMRHESLLLDIEKASEMPALIRKLRQEALHLEDMAEIWEAPRPFAGAIGNSLHLASHYRRAARRIRDAAAAIEREHAAGPWIDLDQPFVHLTEALPIRPEAH